MPAYLYRCPDCGAREEYDQVVETAARCPNPGCPAAPDGIMRRDWKAEGANMNIANLKASRESEK